MTERRVVLAVVVLLGVICVTCLGLLAWLAYVARTLPDGTSDNGSANIMVALATIAGSTSGALGSLLARTGSAPTDPGATTTTTMTPGAVTTTTLTPDAPAEPDPFDAFDPDVDAVEVDDVEMTVGDGEDTDLH